MVHTEQLPIHDGAPPENGTFFALIAQEQAPSRLATTIGRTAQWLFADDQLARTLETVREFSQTKPVAFQEDWENTALNGFIHGATTVEDTFSDSTSGHPTAGAPRARQLRSYTEDSETTANPSFPNLRIKPSHRVQKSELAIAIFNPSRFTTSDSNMTHLYTEASDALQAHISGAQPASYSPELFAVLRDTVVAHGFIEEHDETGAARQWRLPFDEIACLKGLVVLLGPDRHSGYVRQGAVAEGDGQTEIIVAASGQTSAFDELVARAVAKEIVFGKRLGTIS